MNIHFILNGKPITCEIHPALTVLELLRETLALKGTKPGCHEGECGACTVLINGAPINSCLYLAVNIQGKDVLTIEGLMKEDGSLDPVQKAMVDHGAVQCGFCTSGMVMNIKALQDYANKYQSEFSREEVMKWLEGNLCRCTGYVKIIDAAESLIPKN